MVGGGELIPDLRALAEEFAKAEARMKQSENTTDLFRIAINNEMRYAACHLLRAVCPGVEQQDENGGQASSHHDDDRPGDDSAQLEIRRAIDHCKRARYDAIEYETLQRLKKINLFLDDYRLVLSPEMPGVQEALEAAYDAQQLVSGVDQGPRRAEVAKQASSLPEPTKQSRPNPRRERDLDRLDGACGALRAAERKLALLRPALNIKLEQKKRADAKQEKVERWAKYGVIIAALTAACTIARIYLGAK